MKFHYTQIISSFLVLLDFLLESLLLFMIIFKTPKAMTRFKVYLALLCVNSLSMSVCMGFIWQPEFLTPPLCIYSNGLFSSFISNAVMGGTASALLIVNINLLLLSYYFVYSQMNCNLSSRTSYLRIALEVLFVVLPAMCAFILMFYGNSSESYVHIHTTHNINDYPNLVCYFIGDFEADGLMNYAIVFTAICCFLFASAAAFLLAQIRRRLKNPPSYMSNNTLRLQNMFFTNVVVQSLSPLGCVLVPTLSMFGFLALGSHAVVGVLFQFAPIMNMFNSVISSSLIIYLTKPYRDYVVNRFRSYKERLSELSH